VVRTSEREMVWWENKKVIPALTEKVKELDKEFLIAYTTNNERRR